ncbi:MAG: hypothetical protein JSS10_06310 [Verrucomicrobia bacterium]|nr:hypothetical protein [Verrucomicrobiota bacterium]
MKKSLLLAFGLTFLSLAIYAEDIAPSSPSKEIAQWGVGLEVDEGYYYEDDDDTNVEVWIGPGWYNGIWFDNEVEYDDWHHHHHGHHHDHHGHHDHHDHHGDHHGGHHGGHGGSHHGGGHDGGHHK